MVKRRKERNETELSVIRRAYAKQVMFASGADDPRLAAGFAKLPREAFLGPGPWPMLCQASGYRMTPDDDPVYLYQDAVVGIIAEKGLNNGQPSFLALLISLGRLREGEHAVHIGAGVGYYTALIANLVGDSGKVTAIEYEEELARRASANLSSFSQVRVFHGDGLTMPIEPCDVIYVNAGTVHPQESWLNAMKDGGRMILPLTVGYTSETGHSATKGAIFVIERRGDDYHAQWKSDTGIYPCIGARDERSEQALKDAFQNGGWEKVTRLYRGEDIEQERCWVRGQNWALAYW
jgi:protein-L-isoaspartate(D-aspartate) O-methyltransferase